MTDELQLEKLFELYGAESTSEILQLFLQETEGLISESAEAIAKRDSQHLARLCHQLKGTSSFIMLVEMESLARNLGQAAKMNEWNRVAGLYEELKQSVNSLEPSIRSYLTSRNS